MFRPEQVQQLQQLQAHLESERAAKLAAGQAATSSGPLCRC